MQSAVIGIVFSKDKQNVLIIKRRDVDMWVLPGGGIDAQESPEKAVIRELFEETGLQTNIVRKVAEYTPINALTKLTVVFECAYAAGTIATGEETAEIAYHSINSLPENFFHLHKKWLEDALINQKEVIKAPIDQITYLQLFWYFLRHPIRVLRFLLSRLGFPINR